MTKAIISIRSSRKPKSETLHHEEGTQINPTLRTEAKNTKDKKGEIRTQQVKKNGGTESSSKKCGKP